MQNKYLMAKIYNGKKKCNGKKCSMGKIFNGKKIFVPI